MKKVFAIMLIAFATAYSALGQMKHGSMSVEESVIAMEKQGWESWKAQDPKFLQGVLSIDAVIVGDSGVGDKTQYFKDSFTDCKVASYSLSNFKVVMFDKNTAMLTYKSTQDATCGGKPLGVNQWNSSLYSYRGGKWLNVFYQTSTVQ
jgi:Domain of unknown function (DUF4440)